MNNDLSLNHTRWECKYHVVWIPKYRKKMLYGQLRQYLGLIFKELALSRECEVLEGHMMPDHVHMLISIPPKYSVSHQKEMQISTTEHSEYTEIIKSADFAD